MNALKAISKTEDELRVGNYIALFGGRDLEGIATPRKNADGSIGEYFTANTQFESAYTKTGVLYVDWEHGQAEEGEPQRHDVLGYVDWKTARIDEGGLFVERVLNRHNQYMNFLEDLIDAGIIGSSTEPVQDGVEKAEDGEIKAWPMFRDTLTVSPMEPRMLSENTVRALKAIGFDLAEETEEAPEETDGRVSIPINVTAGPFSVSSTGTSIATGNSTPTVHLELSTATKAADDIELTDDDGYTAEPNAGSTPAAAVPEAGEGSTDEERAHALKALSLEIELLELEGTP